MDWIAALNFELRHVPTAQLFDNCLPNGFHTTAASTRPCTLVRTSSARHFNLDTFWWLLYGEFPVPTQSRAAWQKWLGGGRKNCEASTMPDAKGFYQVIETVPRHNNKTDCSGTLIEGPSDQSIRFFQFRSAPDKMLMCQIASVGACFGPLTRTA